MQVVGAVANAGCVLAGGVWLAAHWQTAAPAWYFIVVAVACGMYLADLISGLLHWAFDTWFDETVGSIHRMVITVREHHLYPNRVHEFSFAEHAGPLSWLALLATGPWILLAVLAPGASALRFYLVCTLAVTSILVVLMFETHKCGHLKAAAPRWMRLLQTTHLLLPHTHHMQHHSGNHDRNYCLINGFADLTLGNLGLWRGLEKVISKLTGAVPQKNDHEWLRRYASPKRIPTQAQRRAKPS